MMKFWSTWLLTVAIWVGLSAARDPRGMEHLTRCIKMAEPLVQNPNYIFPLTIQEIRSVCRMWDGFVDCVHEYTQTYLTLSQQQDFNLAIQSSIESIHQLCVGEPDYQRSYMAYAPCLKRISTEKGFCGGQYKYLGDLVQGSSTTDAQLCCAHHKFRDCVLDKTPLECDADGIASGTTIPASRFMRDMLDRALGFLLQKCRDFVPNARDCPRTNLEVPSRTTTTNTNGGDSYNNNHIGSGNGNNNNNNVVRPDATTTFRPGTNAPASTTRFTWTTKGSGLDSPRPTSSVNFGGNGLPESQQFRGAANGLMPDLTSVVALALGLAFRLQ